MCYFIALGVREAGGCSPRGERGRRSGLGVAPAENPHVRALFPEGDRLFWVTHGWCSCDLYKSASDGEADQATLEKERARSRPITPEKPATVQPGSDQSRIPVLSNQKDRGAFYAPPPRMGLRSKMVTGYGLGCCSCKSRRQYRSSRLNSVSLMPSCTMNLHEMAVRGGVPSPKSSLTRQYWQSSFQQKRP